MRRKARDFAVICAIDNALDLGMVQRRLDVGEGASSMGPAAAAVRVPLWRPQGAQRSQHAAGGANVARRAEMLRSHTGEACPDVPRASDRLVEASAGQTQRADPRLFIQPAGSQAA